MFSLTFYLKILYHIIYFDHVFLLSQILDPPISLPTQLHIFLLNSVFIVEE